MFLPLFPISLESSVIAAYSYTKDKTNPSVTLEIETVLRVRRYITYSSKMLDRLDWVQIPKASCNFNFLELLLVFCSLWYLIKEGKVYTASCEPCFVQVNRAHIPFHMPGQRIIILCFPAKPQLEFHGPKSVGAAEGELSCGSFSLPCSSPWLFQKLVCCEESISVHKTLWCKSGNTCARTYILQKVCILWPVLLKGSQT